MKIRIKGNSIRLRLTKTDVKNLKETGKVEEKTILGRDRIFIYTLLVDNAAQGIHATFEDQTISVFLPQKESDKLTETAEITVQGHQDNSTQGKLFILIEKDLKCLDTTFEDQADMYENPKTTC